MAEYWDIYTSDRCKTGEKMKRGSVFPEGAYHLVVHVCIFNKKATKCLFNNVKKIKRVYQLLGCDYWWQCFIWREFARGCYERSC